MYTFTNALGLRTCRVIILSAVLAAIPIGRIEAENIVYEGFENDWPTGLWNTVAGPAGC